MKVDQLVLKFGHSTVTMDTTANSLLQSQIISLVENQSFTEIDTSVPMLCRRDETCLWYSITRRNKKPETRQHVPRACCGKQSRVFLVPLVAVTFVGRLHRLCHPVLLVRVSVMGFTLCVFVNLGIKFTFYKEEIFAALRAIYKHAIYKHNFKNTLHGLFLILIYLYSTKTQRIFQKYFFQDDVSQKVKNRTSW